MSSGGNRAGAGSVRMLAAALALAADLAVLLASTGAAADARSDALAWAYAIAPAAAVPRATPEAAPQAAPVAHVEARYSLPGSPESFTLAEIANRFGPADWYPSDHPAMPKIVATGRMEAGIMACALCHYPNGKGRPENAGLAGLPKAYIVQQLHDFAAGLRQSAEPRKANTNLMIGFARAMTEDEIQQAGEYFSSMSWTPWIEVVETGTVPKTRISGGMHLRIEGADAGTEPIGQEIIESPRSTERTERMRDPRSGFIAYVPTGSLAKGKTLVQTGGTKTIACILCHGPKLEGLALVPPLWGRSPSYIARQLNDFQYKTRQGPWAPLMAQVVEALTPEDVVNLSAYIASLPASDAAPTQR